MPADFAVITGAFGWGQWALITHYISLLITLITSTTLFIYLWSAKRKARKNMGDNDIPYNAYMEIVFEGTLPPIIIGFVHVGLFADLQLVPVGLNTLWFSLTVRAQDWSCINV